MSTQNEVPVTPPQPSYMDAAVAIIDEIRGLKDRIRNYVELARGGNTSPAQIHDLASFAEAFAPLADELEAMALFVRHTVRAARNKAGSEALTAYALAKRLAKRPETASLAPHVEDMRIALGNFGRNRKAKSKPAPTPAPGTSP